MRRCDRTVGISVVKHGLATRSRVSADRSVKDSLTDQAGFNQPAATAESSVVQKDQP